MPIPARADLLDIAICSIILAAAIIALALWLWRASAKERILLWFGLVALIYAAREIAKNPLVQISFGISHHARDYFVSWMDFTLLIPGFLFFEEVLGRGWHSALRWATWFLAAYSITGIVLGLISSRPYVIPEPAVYLLVPLIAIVTLLNTFSDYKRPPFSDLPIVLVGTNIFAAFVLDEHFLPRRFHAEPLGFFALICSLGIVALRRILRNERKLSDVERELAAARQIQSSILPGSAPDVASLKIAARYSPMTSVAGDFYDFVATGPDCVGILIADVAGHGVPAALIASMVKIAFAAQQPHALEPARVLAGLNKIFCGQLRGQYVTAGYAVIDRSNCSARYSGAGHPPLVVWRAATGEVERFENNGLFLGFNANETYPELTIDLFPGDRLILYTDGLLEASNAAGECFSDRLDQRIAAYRHLSAAGFVDALMAELQGWTRATGIHHQEDDVTLVAVDIEQVTDFAERSTQLEAIPA